MSGFLEDLTKSHKEKLKKFKENVADILKPEHNDVLLLRFLRARKFDLNKTEVMFRNDVTWRKENNIDTILETFEVPEALKTYWCGGVSGLDKEGHGVYISPMGNFDPKGVLYSAKTSDILKTYAHSLEDLMQSHARLSEQRGLKHTEGSLMIFDMENLGVHHLWKPSIDIFLKMAVLAEQHYPELIHRMYIIRAPMVFPVAYTIFKPFLQEETRKKLHVLGSNWKEVLLKQIDPDQLPVYWGGAKTDPDGNEMCSSLIKSGGKIPISFYLKDREPPHTWATHQVSRAGVVEFEYQVTKPNSVLRYEFQTDCNDIKFGFHLVDSKGKKTAILKLEKYNSHMVPENGEVLITKPGKCVVTFDNSHSWIQSKKLSYWLELLEPSDVIDMKQE
ncbi:SEC14-like protein 2 [Strongylocentrotus purpuratus]|uniref:SEC14-like protein 2 n=1 Tax=Strongylocentrotus purpuratus TaxID=7668 RepID=A0A7M7P8R4_STRPU|nr:SEC14-like protein 2 [Strongylocentrotus purpuratus]